MRLFDFKAQVASARANGFSSEEQPAATIAICAAPRVAALYEPCDLRQIVIDLSANEVAHTVVVDRSRKRESPQERIPPSISRALREHDIVLEAVSPFRDEIVQGGDTAPTEGVTPLSVRVEAMEVFTCGNAMHPTAVLKGSEDDGAKLYGPTTATVWAKAPVGLVRASSWGRMWPFGEDRSIAVAVSGVTCGINPDRDPIRELSALVLVRPDDNWRITLGGMPKAGGSIGRSRTTQDRQKIGDKSEAATVYTRSRTRGGITTTSTEAYVGEMNFAQSYAVTGRTGGNAALQEVTTLTERDSTWAAPKASEQKTDVMRKIRIERTMGGVTSEVKVDRIVNGVFRLADLANDLSELFDGIPKVGWSISTSVELLAGEYHLGWGIRWPKAYPEESRVHYVERYIELGGSCKVVKAKLELFFGIEVDPRYLDVSIWAKLYIETVAVVELSASGRVSYTNPANAQAALDPIDLGAKASLKFELGGTTGGRAFGYSISVRAALESNIALTVDGKVSFSTEPELKGTLRSNGAKLVGEVRAEGSTRKTHAIKPLQLIKSKVFFKDERFL